MTTESMASREHSLRGHTLVLGRTRDGMSEPSIQSLRTVTLIGASDGVKQLLAPPKNRPYYRQFAKGKF